MLADRRRFLTAQPQSSLPIAALVLMIVTAWCLTRGKLSPEAWSLPTAYLDATYTDFIGAAAWLKCLAAGDSLPFGWKPAPDLAAPATGNWDSFPSPEELLTGFFALLIRSCGLFPGFNLGILIGHVVAAATFYLVARQGFGIGTLWAFVGGLAFGLAPYQFAQQPHHIGCQYIWYLPFFPLVWKWIATGDDLSFGSRRFWQALALGFITGLQNPYYSNIFCQLVLVCGAVRAWQLRSWLAFKPAAMVIAAVALAFVISNLDTFTYRMAHAAAMGDAPLVAQREYKWMDIYGFKLVDLFIPPITHHSAALARFGLQHRQASVLNDEEGSGYLGLLGIGCLLFLVGTAVKAMVDGRAKDVPIEAWWVLWIVIMFTTGGLNAIIAAFTGFTLFRTAIRYSIVVLLLSLLYAAQRMTGWHEKAAGQMMPETLRIATLTAAIGGSLLVLWDQLPRTPTPQQVAAIADAVNSDRAFTAAMEAALPPAADGTKAMVFQLPVMEGLPLAGIPASHHYRPYLYSTQLHYSHGASGKTLEWQKSVQQLMFQGAALDQKQQHIQLAEANVSTSIEELKRKGFAAIYVNRNGFPDRGAGLQQMLAKLGYTSVLDSPAGDLMAVVLRTRE
jgi:phosphoglycerol transferase